MASHIVPDGQATVEAMSMPASSRIVVTGNVHWELRTQDGQVKSAGAVHNLLTQVGDQVTAERGLAGITTTAVPIGMKLGTGSTAPSKTGAGSATVTYISGSYLAFDATYPQSALNGAARRITYRCTFVAGDATSATPITEVMLVNLGTDSASLSANTIARAIISPGAKGALDSLTVTWTADLTGA